MATKPKTLYVPALNKGTTKKPKKSSVREMGARAAKSYEFGNKPTGVNIRKSEGGYLKDVDNATDREWARQVALVWKKDREAKAAGKAIKNNSKRKPASEAWYDQQARNTGMAKGGLVTKKKGK